MKYPKFNYKKDIKLSEMKQGRVYSFGNIGVYYAGGMVCVNALYGSDRFYTVREAINYIKTELFSDK